MTLPFSGVTLPPLWTVAEAKAIQLRITDAAHDEDVAEKLASAQEAILRFIGVAGDPTWTPSTAPVQVKHMILMLTSFYYEHRGDDLEQRVTAEAAIWQHIRHALAFYRDPALA